MKTRFEELAEDLPTDNFKIPWYPGCKGCVLAADDGQNTGYEKAICSIYDTANGKPTELEHSGICDYYLSKTGFQKLERMNREDADFEKGLPIGFLGYTRGKFAFFKVATHKYFGYDFTTKKGEWFIRPYNLAYHGLKMMDNEKPSITIAEVTEVKEAAKATENDYYKTLAKFLNK